MGVQEWTDPAQIRANAMVNRAADGGLVDAGSYSLQRTGSGHHMIGLPRTLIRNCPAEKGDDISLYIDYQRGVAVFDFGGTLAEEGGGDE